MTPCSIKARDAVLKATLHWCHQKAAEHPKLESKHAQQLPTQPGSGDGKNTAPASLIDSAAIVGNNGQSQI
jgi:hypothetical protein